MLLSLLGPLAACGDVARDGGDAVREEPGVDAPAELVGHWRFHLPAQDEQVLAHLEVPPEEGAAVMIPSVDGFDVRVVWTGSPCQVAPTVTVGTRGQVIVVEVDRGPLVIGPDEECPQSAEFHAVDLSFLVDVDAADIDVRVS